MILEAIWQSAYSSSLYQQVQRWRGRAFVYLAVILVLCWTPMFVKGHFAFMKAWDRIEKDVITQIPTITYANGTVTTPENRPYILQMGKGDSPFGIVIDTSGKYASLEGQTAQILVTKTQMHVRKQTGETRIYDFSKDKAQTFIADQAFYARISRFIRRWTIPLVFPFLLALSYLKRLIQAFFIALFGLAVSSALEMDLDLGSLLSLAIVAMTPAMILQTIWNLSAWNMPKIWLFWGALNLGFMLFAMNAASRPSVDSDEE